MRLYLGLMSGTSQDAVDAVILEVRPGNRVRVLGRCTRRYPPGLRRELLAVADGSSPVRLRQLARLDNAVAAAFASTALTALAKAGQPARAIHAIGSHGQTVFHGPDRERSSLQLGNPNLIAARTGITTVADFRRADMAAGGQGAPLVPAFHQAVLGSPRESRVVLNLGGIANITFLPRTGEVTGFDTGPANALLDEWCVLKTGKPFDRNGRWAGGGQTHPVLLEALLADPWFRRRPPKSTGRDYFNLGWVRRRYGSLSRLQPADVQRTLLELSACSIATAIARHAADASRILVCGGGTQNALLMERLAVATGLPVETTAAHGLDPQAVEGAAFAWLAMRAVTGKPGNVPSVTGARKPVVLGGIYPATQGSQ